MFLHEKGDDTESYSRQDLSSLNVASTQNPSQANFAPSSSATQSSSYNPQPQPPQQQAPMAAGSQAMARQGSKDSNDASALPSSASWANKETQPGKAPKSEVTSGSSSASPSMPTAIVSRQDPEPKAAESDSQPPEESPQPAAASSASQPPSEASQPNVGQSSTAIFDRILEHVGDPNFKLNFSLDSLSTEDKELINSIPSLIDPQGGMKRRAMREREEEQRRKQEEETRLALAAVAAVDEDNPESGSLQLGGEPEERHDLRAAGRINLDHLNAIRPPPQQNNLSPGGSGSLPANLAALNVNGRNLTPQQQQQLMLFKSGSAQPNTLDQLQGGFRGSQFEHSDSNPPGLFQNQGSGLGGGQGHARQSSRYSFANDSKSGRSSRQQTMTQNPIQTSQNPLGNHFYGGAVQGPPPGLKTAGTPPISGGGMFGQGHGFTSNMNGGLALGANKDAASDVLREFMRGRSAGAGAGQGHEAAKREFLFPSFLQHPTSSTPASAPSLLGSLYGHQSGAYHDSGPTKHKKKGKKHRHANTSSFGGGAVDGLADPSILQARMHQNTAGGTGQGLFSGSGQGGYNPSNMMYGGGVNRW